MASLRGKAAIIGIGEVPTQRVYPDRTMYGLCAEAAKLAIDGAIAVLDAAGIRDVKNESL